LKEIFIFPIPPLILPPSQREGGRILIFLPLPLGGGGFEEGEGFIIKVV